MIQLLIKRIGALFFSLTVIIVIGFWLTQAMPGDPVQRMLSTTNHLEVGNIENYSQKYDQLYYQLGYEIPDFYFTWTNLCVPDSFYKIPQLNRRNQLILLSSETGNPSKVYAFRKVEEQLMFQISNSNKIGKEVKIELQTFVNRIQQQIKIAEISASIKNCKEFNKVQDVELLTSFDLVKKYFYTFEIEKAGWKLWVPVIKFHSKNHFQQWLFGSTNIATTNYNDRGIFQGDLGYSTVTHRSVSSILKKAFEITFILSTLAIFIALFFSIPIAIVLVLFRNKKIVQLAPGILLFIYTIPVFFLGTLLLMIFANTSVIVLFPSSGIAPAGGFSLSLSSWQIFLHTLPYLVLPLITYTIGSLAFFIRLVQASLIDQLDTDYVKTARAKGASEKRIVSIHALRNCLIPLVTSAATAFPAMISGSIILENIYSIPGMGTEMVRAVQNLDYPVMIGFFLLMGVVTICVYMFSDLLHSYIDPRIHLQMKEEAHA